ncbi:hypothetical protein ACPV3A_03130 [Paenibacillus sp. Dod16]|uniref:hypothetical protein n=1 Tax=Paenibacillus sp. Dod16 TaxID=3416392 RepID=UPI003CF8D8A1
MNKDEMWGQRRTLTLVRNRFVLSATPCRYVLEKIFTSLLQFLAQEDYVKDGNGGTGLTSLEPPFFAIFFIN